ncbi:helix-turn-helix domain-containing protein [Candidatus Woesearchaeota archaeon]|nr:helix-turn-helix domain-containing protein [Candidatus Woesearchaeota archaeon]MCF7900918.1 helix-turn-helix domain-containing protein [Candidatus Woesearchaeota archaeon]MCF8013034.1 helix-turn-helix domain-containing protein [Candidatus Woesearchaeota archaeon]
MTQIELLELEEAGLNKYESTAYQSLVKLGTTTASRISKDSGVPHSRIYDVLDSLEHKGLVKVFPDKTKRFTATNPENLIKLIEEKKKKIEITEKKLVELKQIYEEKETEPVLIATGKKNFHLLMKEIPSAKTFNYAVRYMADTRPEFIRKTKTHIKKGLDEKSLIRYDEETKKNADKFLKETKVNAKQIENEGVIMSLNDNALLLGLIKSNTTLLIKDKAFINFMKKAYNALYKTAKPIKKN